ncbi:MAG: hypothetical protein CM15mP92_1820 [Halieaceae bacterium]|nr:MAG: hypothetical protein CM15mP92_1820 [Halieaceae bacterium]
MRALLTLLSRYLRNEVAKLVGRAIACNRQKRPVQSSSAAINGQGRGSDGIRGSGDAHSGAGLWRPLGCDAGDPIPRA